MSKSKIDIPDKVIKAEKVNWRELEPFQPEGFKEIPEEKKKKLRTSLIKNGFDGAFVIWENRGKQYIIDGHFRQECLFELESEGKKTPDQYWAFFIQCKNKKDAAIKVLRENSIYAEIRDPQKFMDHFNLKFESIAPQISIGAFDFMKGVGGSGGAPPDEDNDGGSGGGNAGESQEISVGEYRFQISKDEYKDFRDDIREAVGFDNPTVHKEIKRRLGIGTD